MTAGRSTGPAHGRRPQIRRHVSTRALRRDIAHVVLHLRLPVQLTLAPLYLWGVFGAAGRWSVATVGGFVVVHVFLYGGTTLFNSYYDRDVGPIAGIERPVALPSWALAFSLAWQAAGALPALLISPAFGALYILYAAVGMLYSHPRWRLKARPYVSAALIFSVQGCGGFLAGWLAGGRTALPLADARFWLMALMAAGTILGLYPLTQVYQIDEDAARGDRTLAMTLGPTGSFAFAAVVLGLAALCGLWVMVRLSRPFDGALLLAGYALLIALTMAIGRRFARSPLLANFRRLVALQFTAAAAFTAFIALQFLQ
jgi:4-hydroxybenzoate polyprenyltransferase